MECRRGWSPEFLAANFPLSFRNDALRKWRRRVLMEREKAVLPAMQEFVEYKRDILRLKKEHKKVVDALHGEKPWPEYKVDTPTSLVNLYTDMGYQYKKMTQEIGLLENHVTHNEDARMQLLNLKRDRKVFAVQFKEIRDKYNSNITALYALNESIHRSELLYDGRAAPAAPERREFIMKCPDDGCRGFLSSAYKCGTCNKYACSKCLVVFGAEKDGAHECNKDTLESVKAIKSETRPCPKCGTRIFKVEGCDQMMCTMGDCNTAFSWNTGKIEVGRIHNPHYYEWLRRTGGGAAPREPGDIPCGGIPDYWSVFGRLSYTGLPNSVISDVAECHRNLLDLADVRMRSFPGRAPANVNKDADVDYLMGTLDEAGWCRQLELTEAKWKRKRENYQILQMAVEATADLFRELVRMTQHVGRQERGREPVYDARTQEPILALVKQLEDLRAFVNESLLALAQREHMAVPQFGELWKWVPVRALYKAAPAAGKRGRAAVADEVAGAPAAAT